MPTKDPLAEVDRDTVIEALHRYVSQSSDINYLKYSLVVLYELLIVLVSMDSGGTFALDKYGKSKYGNDDWLQLVRVSNVFRHNSYDNDKLKMRLRSFISSKIAIKVLVDYGYPREEAIAYNHSLKAVMEVL